MTPDDGFEGETLALNVTTGLVHDYRGTVPGGYGKDGIGALGIRPCGCEGTGDDLFKEAVENDNLIKIEGRHMRRGVYEPAECLRERMEDL